MSKDMYDEKGLLRPEFEITDAQRKSMLYNNKTETINYNKINYDKINYDKEIKITDNDTTAIKEKLNKSLKQMQKDVMYNIITLSKFEEYYILIAGGIAAGLPRGKWGLFRCLRGKREAQPHRHHRIRAQRQAGLFHEPSAADPLPGGYLRCAPPGREGPGGGHYPGKPLCPLPEHPAQQSH